MPAFLRLAALVAVTVLAGACSGEEKLAAHVGDDEISVEQLDEGVEHIVEELRREGRDAPAEGSQSFDRLEEEVLGLLVYRSQVEQAAARLGIRIDEEAVERRLERSTVEEESEEDEAFVAGAVRTQLALEEVARRLARGIAVSAADVAAYYRSHAELFRTPPRTLDQARADIRRELATARRNEALRDWIAQARRSVAVTYEPGYAISTR